MYTFTLETIFPKEEPGQDRGLKQFKSVLAQILGTMEPLALDSLMSTRGHFKDLADIKIHRILAPMAAFLSGATDPCPYPSPSCLLCRFSDGSRSESRIFHRRASYPQRSSLCFPWRHDEETAVYVTYVIDQVPTSPTLKPRIWMTASKDVSQLNWHILADSGWTAFDMHRSTWPLQKRSLRFSITRYCYSSSKCLASSMS